MNASTSFQIRSISCIYFFFLLLLVGCSGWDDILPLKQIPTELNLVADNQEQFSEQDHPLRQVTPGTHLDDAAALNGCWGRVAEEVQLEDSLLVVQVLKINLPDDRLTDSQLRDYEGITDSSFPDRFVLVCKDQILHLDNGVLDRQAEFVRYGLISEDRSLIDGSLSDHLTLTFGASLRFDQFETRFSVQGDYLVMEDKQFDRANPDDPPPVDLYRRFDCPDED